jgi:hypothetical protein
VEAAQAALVDLQNKEAEANAVLATAEKQKADAEKKRADAVLFEISGANGLVCRCRIPTAAVAQRGLFRILLGTLGTQVSDVKSRSVDPGFHFQPSDFNDGGAFSNFSGNTSSRADPGFQYSDNDFLQPNGKPY